MKKALFALLALGGIFALPSCNSSKQETTPAPEWVTITIGLRPGYETGTIGPATKALGDDITATLPTAMSLSLTNKANGDTYDLTTGQPFRIPTGTYSVAGRTDPAPYQFIYDPTHYTSREPLVVVEDEVTITAEAGTYYVAAGYRCFVVGVNNGEVSHWTLRSGTMWPEVARLDGTTAGWIFVIGDFDAEHPLLTKVTFPDGTEQEYHFYTRDLQAGGILAQYGRWYILRQAGGTPQYGNIGLTFPEWTAGN